MSISIIQAARGLGVNLVAALGGPMLSELLWFRGPLEIPIVVLPFTFFGSVVVLCPTYLWARHVMKWDRRRSYLAVLLAGIVGSYFVLAAFVLLLGGVTANALPMNVIVAGLVSGVATAIVWIASHHLVHTSSTR